VVFDLLEDHLSILRVALFKLLLKVTTTMLILAQTVNFALDVLEGNIVEAGGFYRYISTSYNASGRHCIPSPPWLRLC